MSVRENMPARRPVNTMTPATAFCRSFRHATDVKSAATSTEHRVPCNAASTTLVDGVSGKVRRALPRSHTDASGSRCAGNHTTEGSTGLPGKYGAKSVFCSMPFCSTQTIVLAFHSAESHGAVASTCVDLTATKTRSNVFFILVGSICTGPGTTI